MIRMLAIPALVIAASPASATISYLGSVAIAGDATDLSGFSPAFGANRLSIGSDLWYDRRSGTYWGVTDRGPGGGVIDFAPRAHQFALDIAPNGTVGGFTLLKTVVFRDRQGNPMSGLNPRLLNGNAGVLGNSFDSEGLVVDRRGHFFVADEYGPSLYEFDRNGILVREFRTPANLLPRDAAGTLNYVDGRAVLRSGRQDNRGFEGLALSKDGKTLIAVLQDPLVNEGAVDGGRGDGRRSRNVRVVLFDKASGEATAQFIYQLEDRADINARLPAGAAFGATAQGRNIGLSGIIALPNGKYLFLERDNRGWGVEDPTYTGLPVGTKRIWLVDFAGATDVSTISLDSSNALPAGVVPVQKTLWLDVEAALREAGAPVTEKMEGIAFGPRLGPGLGFSFVVVTDNDFSVTQTGGGTQFDVCTSGIGGISSQVALGNPCPEGQFLIPTYAYVFGVRGRSLLAAGIPEPASWALMIAGFGLVGAALRRRRPATA